MISDATMQTYTGSTDSVLLAQLRDGWVEWLQAWIPRYLGTSTTLTEVHSGPQARLGGLIPKSDGERTRTIWLSEAIAEDALTSVKYRTTHDTSWADLATDSNGDADLTQFEIRPWSPHVTVGYQLVYKNACFPQGHGNLQVKYTHGYAEDAGPADVTLTLLELVKAGVEAHGQGNLDAIRDEDGQIVFAKIAGLGGVNMDRLLGLKRGNY